MKLLQIRWGRALIGGLVAEIVLIAAAFAWVAFYSHVLHRGESAEFYQHYALRASPWVSVVAGFPVFFFAARWVGARSPATAWPTAMPEAYAAIFPRARSLPGYQLVGVPAVEIYHAKVNVRYELNHTDICLPVTRSQGAIEGLTLGVTRHAMTDIPNG
jgi:hypothetical protein